MTKHFMLFFLLVFGDEVPFKSTKAFRNFLWCAPNCKSVTCVDLYKLILMAA